MAHIAIVALGSRGDVEPFVALGLGLQAAGHRVRLLAVADYEPLVRGYGLPFQAVVGSVSEHMDRELVYDALDGATNPLALARRMVQAVEPLVPRLLADCVAGCRGAELLLASTLGMFVAAPVAEALGVPCLPCHLHPYSATSAEPSVSFPALPPWVPLRSAYNMLTHTVAEQGFWQLLKAPLGRARRDVLGLRGAPPNPWQRAPLTLYGYSEQVLPRPPDWPATAQVCGYWFLDPPAGWNPEPALVQFLAAGPPPLYLSFGSTLLGRNPQRRSAEIVAGLAAVGCRALLSSGWGDLGGVALPERMLLVGAVPHRWLFERVAAVVHHGGAGTTAAALLAGVPALAVPVYGDQFLWARRLHELAAGPLPLPRSRLGPERLEAAVRELLQATRYRDGARRVAERLRRDDGVARAVELIGRLCR